jgi:hypothetical protein
VGDADHLAPLGQRAQLSAHGASGLAADARIHLVEDERRLATVARDAHQRQHHA